jgi:hypothetical protein
MEQRLDLAEFLVKAKTHTYARAGEGGERTIADGGKELVFEQGPWKYRDRYFGWNPFAGEEIVWSGEATIWVMNYYGVVSADSVPVSEVYRFLRKAMQQVTIDRPFRGPQTLREVDFEYRDESQGTVERFTGVERILHQGREIYRLEYHGGMVKAK